jgi:hypothetical protein
MIFVPATSVSSAAIVSKESASPVQFAFRELRTGQGAKSANDQNGFGWIK